MDASTTGASATFLDLALARLLAKAEEAGEQVAVRPDLAGANSVFGLVTHCLGVGTFWLDHVVVGRPATGTPSSRRRAPWQTCRPRSSASAPGSRR
ncbi:MAG: DUF664 domain-containing protein [Actinomycetota bacterium]|nr:DUF664 domain-containing protein [Actinomycetota bacterium]